MSWISCSWVGGPSRFTVCQPLSYSTTRKRRIGIMPCEVGKSANTSSPRCRAATTSETSATCGSVCHSLVSVLTGPHSTPVTRPSASSLTFATAWTFIATPVRTIERTVCRARASGRAAEDPLGGTLGDHQGGGVGVAAGDRRHDAGIDDAQSFNAMDAQARVDDGYGIARPPHLRRA